MDRIFRNAMLFLLAGACCSFGQTTDGKLTVTATVMTSVSLVIDTDGAHRILIANAADPADNVSKLVFAMPDALDVQANVGSTLKLSNPPEHREVWNQKPKTKADGTQRFTLYRRSVQRHEY